MGRRKNNLPEVGKRMIRGAWSIYWWWGGKMFSLAVGVSGEDMEEAAEAVRRAISSAVAAGTPFPSPFDAAPAAIAYREKRYGCGDETSDRMKDSTNWLTDYEAEICQECTKSWAIANMSMLKALDKEIGSLKNATPDNMSQYLAKITEKTSISTRNRTRNAFSRFYRWAIRTKRFTNENPVSPIPTLTEPRITNIIYCTPAEREEFIQIAQRTRMKEWLAVPIAFYSGMRREEIAKMRWDDVRMAEGVIIVVESKTKTSRTFPLNNTLEEYLRLVPKAARKGFVVPSDYEDRVDALIELERAMKRIITAVFKQRNPPPRIPRITSEAYADLLKNQFGNNVQKLRDAFKEEYAEWEKPLIATLERIGWNSFRHTFGSLLAQAGVSIDKISAWMGNTPDVCRRHYAQFTPRDRRDSEIDKL